MRSSVVLVMAVFGCAAAPSAPPSPAPVVAPTPPAPAVATVTRCSAEPSTIYGEEPVVFALEGQASLGALAQVSALDEREQVVFSAAASVPGRVTIPSLPSGDFSLKIAGSSASCGVTVNRELSRGTPVTR